MAVGVGSISEVAMARGRNEKILYGCNNHDWHILAGISPNNRLFDKSRTRSSVRRLISAGIVPSSPFVESSKVVNAFLSEHEAPNNREHWDGWSQPPKLIQ